MSSKIVAGVKLTAERECGDVVAWVTPEKCRIVKTPRGWVNAGAGDFETHRDLLGAVMRLKEMQYLKKHLGDSPKARGERAA